VCRPTPLVIVIVIVIVIAIAIVIVPTVGERARDTDLRAASADWSADYVVNAATPARKPRVVRVCALVRRSDICHSQHTNAYSPRTKARNVLNFPVFGR
jgi:hypothetical protein